MSVQNSSAKLPVIIADESDEEIVLPDDWETQRIGDLLDAEFISATNGFSSGQHNQDGIGTPHMRPFNVTPESTISLDQIKSVPNAGDGLRLHRGDVLFNNTNTEELVGKTAIWNRDDTFAFSNHMTRIRVTKPNEVCAHFLAYSLHFHWLRGKSQQLCRRHVAQASIMGERFREIAFAFPPEPEQKKIAAVLWRVQRAVEVERKLISGTRALKSATMRHLFTHGLHADEERDTPYGTVPAAWDERPLGACCHVQSGATKGRKIAPEDAIEAPYLRVANVQDGHLDLSEMKTITIRRDELDGYRLQDGDVVLTEGGDFDKLGRGFIWRGEVPNCIHQNHVFAVRANREIIAPEYLAYLAQSPYGRQYFLTVAHKTTNLACINATKLRAFPLVFPHDKDEQREIARQLAVVDAKIGLHERRREILRGLFRTLLRDLLTARRRVYELDIDVAEVTAA